MSHHINTADFSYHMPSQIVFGTDKLHQLAHHVKGRKTLLITSKGFVARGLVEQITEILPNLVGVYSDIPSHPEFTDLEAAYQQVHQHDFELLLAIGGGSVLDATKYFSVYNDTAPQPKNAQFVSAIIKGTHPKSHYQLTPIIAVPTTAGTGSEITPWATVWDKQEKKKYSLHLPDLFPEVALYDARLTLSVPKAITIQTGLDTLSHALESIWNKNANEITIRYAIQAAKLVITYLPLLANDLNNLNYRTQLLKACMYSGLAFSNTQTALAHAMSYYITNHKGIDHGLACSFTLPMLIDLIIGQHEFIDKALMEIFGDLSSDKLRAMFKTLNISTSFSDYGISNDELAEIKASLGNTQRAGNSLVILN